MGNKKDIKAILLNGRSYLLTGLTLIAVGLAISKPLLSLGLIFIVFSWVIDGKLKEKLNRVKSNKLAWVLASIYLIT
ncbi:MAG: hypothetical protein KDD41_09630, partial [Flavobacteriales bacterium]|nr:hypothetical protein [Flavobacteriales bacterium]